MHSSGPVPPYLKVYWQRALCQRFVCLAGPSLLRQSLSWLLMSSRSAKGEPGFAVPTRDGGSGLSYWGSAFSLCVMVFMKQKRHWATQSKPVGTHLPWKTKFLTSPQPWDRGFHFQTTPQQDQQTFEVSTHSRFKLSQDSKFSLWNCTKIHSWVVDLKTIWAHNVLH